MKNLVRGGAILLLSSMLVVFVYAQVRTESTLAIAIDSLDKIENNISNKALVNNINVKDNTLADKTDDVKKLVKTTGSVKAVGAGASRGAFSATAYCLKGRTAMGHGVRRGIIAADPRVLRLGSTIMVNGGAYSGNYLVSDTGGSIKGKRLDIWMPNCSEARRFGRRTVQVFAP